LISRGNAAFDDVLKPRVHYDVSILHENRSPCAASATSVIVIIYAVC
jgi:hypothetical protein